MLAYCCGHQLQTGGSGEKLSNPEINGPETIGHEAFLHLSQYVDDYIKAFEENGSTGSKAVLDNYKKDNYKGYEAHFSMTNDKQGRARKYYEFINQLSKVLNPAAVQKHVNKEREKNYNTAKFHKKQSQ